MNQPPALRKIHPAALFAAFVLFAGCGDSGSGPGDDACDPPGDLAFSGSVLPVLQENCSIVGCHDETGNAAGLQLTSYGKLADGSTTGSVTIPYAAEQSPLLQRIQGRIEPRMPLGGDPLSEEDMKLLRCWIEQGASTDDGTAMYSASTRKAFVACQGEDAVAVLDMESNQLIRLIEVVAPHSVFVDEAAREVYVSRFETATDNLRVYDADTYELLRTGEAGTFPALMMLTPDRSQLWVTNFDQVSGDNAVRVFDPSTLTQTHSFTIPNAEVPHGLDMTADGSLVYVTNILTDNVTIYRTTPAPAVVKQGIAIPAGTEAHQPQQCVLSADDSRLFVSTLGTDKVFVMDTASYAWTASVDVGDTPWHLTLAPGGTELWVANWVEGSVSVVDVTSADAPAVLATLQPTMDMSNGMPMNILRRPIGISFTPDGSRVYVSNANDDDSAGHHPTPGGQKNPGSVTIFDATSREVIRDTSVPNFARFVSFLP
ncbi:MAG: beta-propeller fold lactonase family protein [Gemmatimonadota bacterium]|jgi:YVTN family beta-propeller protein|nr:beta-propeller fold lactonase family protein [Gemmatimonadota bacterium]